MASNDINYEIQTQRFGAGELQNINNIITGAAQVIDSEKPCPDCITQVQQKDFPLFTKSYTDFINTLLINILADDYVE